MAHIRSILARLAEYFGAHHIPESERQERERAQLRGVVCLSISSIWVLRYMTGTVVPPQLWIICALGVMYSGTSFFYQGLLRRFRIDSTFILYVFLIFDPLFLIAVLIGDPETFAFLNPFVLVVIVRSGIRYGVRTMYLAWGAALAGATLLSTSEFWRAELELTLAFLLMLVLAPMFFSSLIRRVHNVRAVEEERARLIAMNEVSVARSVFLAKVSHELRSPLQSIVSALDVIEMRHGNAFAHDAELIGRMRRSALLLNTHLRDLLTLAKGEAGRLELHPEAFEACSLVDSLAEAGRELALAKGLKVVVELPAEAVFVVADSSRIDQVLTNLVVNSIRYTDAGQVRISLEAYDPSTRRLHFTVSDTGPGIAAEALPTLFSPHRAVTSGDRRGQGSGLGLAIVRTLVDHLGGTIAVTSGAGKGTRFDIEFPAEPASAELAAHAPDEPTGRILVVDDRDDVLDALTGVIDEFGFQCDRACSAAAGANLLAARRYDAVLLDIDMPGKGGSELALETRRGNGPNRDTRFVGMSAAEVAEKLGSNFDACLTKPIDRVALRRTLLGEDHGARPSQPGLWEAQVRREV